MSAATGNVTSLPERWADVRARVLSREDKAKCKECADRSAPAAGGAPGPEDETAREALGRSEG